MAMIDEETRIPVESIVPGAFYMKKFRIEEFWQREQSD